jgi:protein SCO1
MPLPIHDTPTNGLSPDSLPSCQAEAVAPCSMRRHLLAGLAALAGGMGAARAHQGHAHGPAAAAADARPPAWSTLSVPEASLIDHDGRVRRLRSELVGERIVVADFIFTSCTAVCPLMSASMAQLQARLGSRLGREVVMLSLSVDPLRDTPARLRQQRERFQAGPQWHWLTGAKPQVDALLRALGAYAARPDDHAPQVLIADPLAARALRLNGLPSVQALHDAVQQVAALRAGAAGAGS